MSCAPAPVGEGGLDACSKTGLPRASLQGGESTDRVSLCQGPRVGVHGKNSSSPHTLGGSLGHGKLLFKVHGLEDS